MKKNTLRVSIIALILIMSQSLSAKSFMESDSLGLLGDDLDLYAVLDLFKQSKSVEEFEKSLNNESSKINNLDLNEDGEIDYISVIDRNEGDIHALTLQVGINEKEQQDVACIAIEKKANEDVAVQIIGDEDFYGSDYLIEPTLESIDGGKGSNEAVGAYVNVWFWPSVRYVYSSSYVVWISPWGWHHYPMGWKPWKHCGWGRYHAVHAQHQVHYTRVYACTVLGARRVYTAKRVKSATVAKNHASKKSQQVWTKEKGRPSNSSGVGEEKKNSSNKNHSSKTGTSKAGTQKNHQRQSPSNGNGGNKKASTGKGGKK